MPSLKNASDNPICDIIPLEGAFVREFLSEISPSAVKIYLYCLYLINHPEIKPDNIEQLALATSVSKGEVKAALDYLSKKQLLNFSINPLNIEMKSAFYAAKQNSSYAPDELIMYKDYFAGLRGLMPERNLSPSDYDKARDWVEIYGLPQEVALMMVSHCIETKDKKLSFNYIDKVALSWAEDNIKSVDSAVEYLQMYELRRHNAAKILLHLGVKRIPTIDETKLYEKWNKKMQFSHDAIIAACRETTKTSNPSFAYLDKILDSLDKQGLHDHKAIKAYLETEENVNRNATSVLYQLGHKGKGVNPEISSAITAFIQDGFNLDALIYIAKQLSRLKNNSFERFCQVTETYKQNNCFTIEAISQYTARKKEEKNNVKQTNAHQFDKHDNIDYNAIYTDIDSLEE